MFIFIGGAILKHAIPEGLSGFNSMLDVVSKSR